jgi:hypothetical protein
MQFKLTLLRSLLVVMFLFAASVQGQVITADVTGAVADSTGKVVPGATVTITNVGTGASRTTTTNESGEYTITELTPGMYTVTVEAQSFSKSVLKDLELNVGSRRTINIELKPGQITEVVEVSTEGALIETTRSDLDQTITPKEIENLPLLNRTFAGLSVIAPEARPAGNFDPTKTRIGNFAMNGGDGRQVNVNVDGGDNKDHVVGSLLQNFSYESVQEFQVLQHRWTAEQGRAVGGVVNVITKSGTNQFRGSFFANFRDEKFRALDYFDRLEKNTTNPNFRKPEFNRQEVGGSLGGPIVKDRAFFFFALERFRERQNVRILPNTVANLQLIPGVQFVPELPSPYDDTLLSAKVDHKLTEKQNMFYRYSYQKSKAENDQITFPPVTDLSGGNTNDNKMHSFVVNHTYNLTPTTLNQFTFHVQDFFNEILGVSNNPLVTFGVPSVVQIGPNTNVPQSTTERKYQFRNDFSWIAGDHSLKFGVNYIYTKLGGYFYFGAKGYTINFFDTPQVITTNTTLYPQGFATPGAVRTISFSDGEASHDQIFHQHALYVQDDWKVTRKLTLNLGLRWDANVGNLTDQTNNRTIKILQQINDPLAQAIVGDPKKLSRRTPSWTEFQPRVGFAYDPWGDGKTVIRGGYGIFYDQLFQNLTIFSLTQSQESIYQQALTLTNSAVGVGQLATFRYGVDPLPTPPAGFSFANLGVGGFGRINDPDMREPYVQKFSFGFQRELGRGITLSSDYVHTLGLFEPRVQNINPRIANICDPLFPGSNPSSPLCVRGVNSRRLDRAFVNAGLPANRLEQINMIGTTNRSLFDSWTTQLKYRRKNILFNASYVLASSRSWGGQPTASYSGNGIAITPENQFKEEEFGPTRLDERHRIIISGVVDLPWGFQVAPILQYASARPYSPTAGVDLDGDGSATNDRLCEGTDPLAVLQAMRNRPAPVTATPNGPRQVPVAPSAFIFTLQQRGCRQTRVNSQRKGFIVDAQGNVTERDGRFFNVDVRVAKEFRFGERFKLSAYADFYNVFNTENLAFAGRPELSPATNAGLNPRAATGGAPALSAQSGIYLQPVSLFGPGFGPPVGRPFTAQFGARFTF